jgi:CdiI immunity protein
MNDDHRQKPLIKPSDYKALTAFLRGYLHQDFSLEHKTPAAALEAYRRQATPEEFAELKRELARFLRQTGTLPFEIVQRIFTNQLGSYWLPKSHEDLARLCACTAGRSAP